ncbi:nucleic acid-binding, OB-fold protein, partial [Tanacetum coccineum]
SIQPFGAFIGFGAFTDGLVHVSRLSDGYVKDVANIISVGQEVKVKLVEANIKTGRIALTMRENKSASGGDSSRPLRKTGQGSGPRRNEGAFINLPEGEEGFLPQSEEADEGFGSLMGDGSSLEGKLEETTVDEKVEAEAEISAKAKTQASVEETKVASPEPEEVEKVKPISDKELNPEETSSITGCSEQVDAPVVEENVVKGLNSCSSVTRGDKIVTSEEKVEVPEETSKEQVE